MGELIAVGSIHIADYRRKDKIFDAKLSKYDAAIVTALHARKTSKGYENLVEAIGRKNEFIHRYLAKKGLI